MVCVWGQEYHRLLFPRVFSLSKDKRLVNVLLDAALVFGPLGNKLNISTVMLDFRLEDEFYKQGTPHPHSRIEEY